MAPAPPRGHNHKNTAETHASLDYSSFHTKKEFFRDIHSSQWHHQCGFPLMKNLSWGRIASFAVF